MTGTLITIHTDGSFSAEPLAREPERGRRLHAICGGFIEQVPFWTRMDGEPAIAFRQAYPLSLALLRNEEARPEPPVNNVATALWWAQHRTADHLRGDVAVIKGAARREDEEP